MICISGRREYHICGWLRWMYLAVSSKPTANGVHHGARKHETSQCRPDPPIHGVLQPSLLYWTTWLRRHGPAPAQPAPHPPTPCCSRVPQPTRLRRRAPCGGGSSSALAPRPWRRWRPRRRRRCCGMGRPHCSLPRAPTPWCAPSTCSPSGGSSRRQSLSRKIVHVLSGVLFMSSWPLFSNSTEARYFAAVVPFLNSMRLLTYGLRLSTDEALVKSVTREGKPEELLRGPLYYVLVLLFSVLVFWRESAIGIVSLSMMSGGDGFADIVGRRYGSVKLPFNEKKSWIGSISMFISGFLLSAIMLFYFSSLGYIHVSWEEAFGKLALVALAATVVECIPVIDVVDDNISVPLATMLVAFLLFGSNTQ
uniref:phytol kinase n=1 Tax=Setaria italica TaxID=4555 RepID=K3Z7B2_SETIT